MYNNFDLMNIHGDAYPSYMYASGTFGVVI